MLEGLLDWGQMQIGKTHFSPEYSELTKLTENVVNQFLVIALSKKINLINNVKNGLTIYADSSMIETVLRNLISNAIKFTPIDGEVTIDAVNSSDDYVIVSVSDTGIGIDKDKLESLFKDSFNTSTLGTDGEKGTGLGLSLSKDFIEKNGGEIWAESEIEKGTAFFFSIPIKETNHN
jgi:signal transduction histidine kinase